MMGGPSMPSLTPLPDQAGGALLFCGHRAQVEPIGRADDLVGIPGLTSLALDRHIGILLDEGAESEIGRDVHYPRLIGNPTNRARKRLRAVPKGRENTKLFDRPLFPRNGIYDVLDGVMDAGFGGIKDLGGPFDPPHRLRLHEEARHKHAREQHAQNGKEEDLEEDGPALGPSITALQVLVRAEPPHFRPLR